MRILMRQQNILIFYFAFCSMHHHNDHIHLTINLQFALLRNSLALPTNRTFQLIEKQNEKR